jgi:hypothetical protein
LGAFATPQPLAAENWFLGFETRFEVGTGLDGGLQVCELPIFNQLHLPM